MRINTSKISGRIRVRIQRPWRGYPIGAIIAPPAGLRQIILQAKDQLGRHIAVIEPEPKPPKPEAKPPEVKTPQGSKK